MSALSDYQAGLIDYPTYFARNAEEKRAREQAAKMAALATAGASGSYNPQLIASEQALAQASYQQAQRQAAERAAIARQQAQQQAEHKAAQDRLLAQRQADQAAANARIAAGQADAAANAAEQARAAKTAAQQLAAAQAAERTALDQAARAQAAQEAADSARVSELTEAARQEMLQETGRVVAPELEGSVIGAAMGYVQAEREYALGLRDTPIPDSIISYGVQQSMLDLYVPVPGRGGVGHTPGTGPPAGQTDAAFQTFDAPSKFSPQTDWGEPVYYPSLPSSPPGEGGGSFPADSLASLLGLFTPPEEDTGTPPTLTEGGGGLAELLSPGRLLLLVALGLGTGVWLTS